MHVIDIPAPYVLPGDVMPCALCIKQVKVLDPLLIIEDSKLTQKQTVAGTDMYWRELNGNILEFEPSLCPSALCFAAHMRRAVAEAEARGWIPEVCKLVMLPSLVTVWVMFSC
jgi:hypothetical protein